MRCGRAFCVDNTPGCDQTVEMEPLTLTELGRRVAGRWPTLLILAVIGLVSGLAYHLLSATEYQAEAIIRVDAADPELVDMAAEEALAESRQVTNEALDALDRPGLTIGTLEKATKATAVPDSRVLQISYAADSPSSAARGANAVAQAYLAVRAVDVERRVEVEKVAASTADIVDPARNPAGPTGPGLVPLAAAGLVLGLLVAVPIAARPRGHAAEPEPDSVK